VKFEADQIFTHDGNVWTSAGITAGIDLALAMVTEDHGEETAQQAARQLVLHHRRSGAVLIALGIEDAERLLRRAAVLACGD
jgi:transcriptional regulator GlxA family with amidase domain